MQLEERVEDLQEKIRSCEIEFSTTIPHIAVTCHQDIETVIPVGDFSEYELCRRAIAVAEIFRHATHIYVYRIAHAPSIPPSKVIQSSIDAIFNLLPFVPDAIGPGANLGWAIVVVGAETDSEERREYLRCRWHSMEILGLRNTDYGGHLLEQVWNAQNKAKDFNRPRPRWQDIMRETDSDQILV